MNGSVSTDGAGLMRVVRKPEFVKALEAGRREYHRDYFAMYSSALDGMVTDPELMVVPIDDHLVHRGDGVFETFKCVAGGIYNMRAHLDRLRSSAEHLSLSPPGGFDQAGRIAVETARAGGKPDCLLRVLLSRGPGSFGVSPYDCPASQLYIVAGRLPPPFMQTHPEGARAGASSVAAKDPFLATNKTCNYIPNMLMKKEAIDRGLDFVAGFDPNGCLTEGATENFGIAARDGRLLFPRLERILAGTTMLRVAELAGELVRGGALKAVAFEDIGRDAVFSASEVFGIGTTINVTAVVEFEGKPIGSGKPGPVWKALDELLLADMFENPAVRTPVFGSKQPARSPTRHGPDRPCTTLLP